MLLGQYWHLFGMPLWPRAKAAGSQCRSCGLTQEEHQIDAHHSKMVTAVKSNVRYPLRMFAGTIGLVLLATITTALGYGLNQEQGKVYINPQSGQVYSVYYPDVADKYKWGLWKVDRVTNDSVYFYQNMLLYDKNPLDYGLGRSNDGVKDLFTYNSYPVSIEGLKDMFRDGYMGGIASSRWRSSLQHHMSKEEEVLYLQGIHPSEWDDGEKDSAKTYQIEPIVITPTTNAIDTVE